MWNTYKEIEKKAFASKDLASMLTVATHVWKETNKIADVYSDLLSQLSLDECQELNKYYNAEITCYLITILLFILI